MPAKKPRIPQPIYHPALKLPMRDMKEYVRETLVKHRAQALKELEEEISRPNPFLGGGRLTALAAGYGCEAGVHFGWGDFAAAAEPFLHAVEWRRLKFVTPACWLAFPPHKIILAMWGGHQCGLQSIGPLMLSQWDQARTCAWLLVRSAEQMRSQKDPTGARGLTWSQGSVVAFLTLLSARVFDIATTYTPAQPLLPVYRALLDNWDTTDAAAYQAMLYAAAEFHIAHSGNTGKKKDYEFDNLFDRVFPSELLCLQALRRRAGLPEVQADHALVDAPWRMIRDLPAHIAPLPQAQATEDRLRRDYPLYAQLQDGGPLPD